MALSWLLPSLIAFSLLGDILAVAGSRGLRSPGSAYVLFMATGSLIFLILALLFGLSLFTQVWVSRPGAISGPAMAVCVGLAAAFSAAALATCVVLRRRLRHAAA